MTQTFWLEPVRRGPLLDAILHALSGRARVAVEVKAEVLTQLGLLAIREAREGLVAPFSRHGPGTMVVLPLQTAEDADAVSRALTPALRRPVQVEAIQIERDGEVEFLAADQFHHECVSVGPAVPEDLLADLRRRGIIRGYRMAAKPPENARLG